MHSKRCTGAVTYRLSLIGVRVLAVCKLTTFACPHLCKQRDYPAPPEKLLSSALHSEHTVPNDNVRTVCVISDSRRRRQHCSTPGPLCGQQLLCAQLTMHLRREPGNGPRYIGLTLGVRLKRKCVACDRCKRLCVRCSTLCSESFPYAIGETVVIILCALLHDPLLLLPRCVNVVWVLTGTTDAVSCAVAQSQCSPIYPEVTSLRTRREYVAWVCVMCSVVLIFKSTLSTVGLGLLTVVDQSSFA